MQGSDLYDYAEKRNFQLGEERAREIAWDLVQGLQYLHSFGIVHRDLKLENVMMTSDKENAVAKIVDFGLSKMIGPDEKAKEPFGTLGYCAPEILNRQAYTSQCDVWSLGCIVYGLLTGQLPFDHEKKAELIRMTQ